MSFRIEFRIRFLIDFGIDFGFILGAKTVSVARVDDPPNGVGAVGAPQNVTKGLYSLLYPLRHRFWSNFQWILVDSQLEKA